MESVEDVDKSSTLRDSGYSYSYNSNNSKSTQSSKSKSESNSSGSSGYRGKNVETDNFSKDSNSQSQTQEKRESDEVTSEENNIKTTEDIYNHEAQAIEIKTSSLSAIEAGLDGIDNAYLTSPPASVGDVGKETENMDITTSENNARLNNELVFPVKAKNYIQRRICDSRASVICTIDYPISHCSDGFFCVMSLVDGIVMYTTMSISSALGFPREMMIGRTFTDFIHPNDRDQFVSQVTHELKLRQTYHGSNMDNTATMFCRVRRHKLLMSGFGIKERTPSFRPFHFKFFFKNIPKEYVLYLIIQAMSFTSAFKTPNEKLTDPSPFEMKHNADGTVLDIDRESISYLGYLPQDIIDKDIFDFYHPEDLIYLYEVYQTVVKNGSCDRSRSYRMLAQNGDYIKLETEFVSYVNPLTKKLENITGKHHVVEGPSIPNVFDEPSEDKNVQLFNEKENMKTRLMKNGIKKLLNDVLSKPTKIAKQQMNKRCQEIAAFMNSFLDKTIFEEQLEPKTNKSNNGSIILDCTLSQHCSDSKSSTGSSVSYDRLNYDEMLQRYFDSYKACTDFSELSVFKKRESTPGEGSNQLTIASTTSGSATTSSNQTCWLSEELLNKHNEDMEKKLLKTHYKNKYHGKRDKAKSRIRVSKQKLHEHLERCNKSYQPTTADHMSLHNILKRPHQHMFCPLPHKTLATAVREEPQMRLTPSIAITPTVPLYYTSPMPPVLPVMETYTPHRHDNNILPVPHSVPYMMHSQPFCGMPFSYAPINQLPYSTEQNCMKHRLNTPGVSSGSNGDSTDTTQYHQQKKVKLSNSEETVYNTDEDLSFSSVYSSFFKTDSKSAEDTFYEGKEDGKFWHRRLLMDDVSSNASCEPMRAQNVVRKKMDPPWLERVCVTSELIYKYQIIARSVEEVLSDDRKELEKMRQPALVNEQLEQLYTDLHLEGVTAKLTLEEGITSSGSSSDEATAHCSKNRKIYRRRRGYDRMSILFEEDAPLPPPEENEVVILEVQ